MEDCFDTSKESKDDTSLPSPEQEESAEKHEEVEEKRERNEDGQSAQNAPSENGSKKSSEQSEERSPVKTKKQKIKTAVKAVLIALLIGLSVGIMFGLGKYVNDGQTKSFTAMLRDCFNPRYFLLFLSGVLGYIFFECFKYAYLLKVYTGKWRVKNSVKTMFLGKYYDAITPLGTGGQPFQIYYLHKRGVPAGAATAVPLVRYIVTKFVFGLLAIVFLALTPAYFRGSGIHSAVSATIMAVAWIALFFNLLVPTLIIVLSAFEKAGKKMIMGIVKLLSKMHLVKHRYSVTKKYFYEVAQYRDALKSLVQEWWRLIPLILITLAETMLYLTLPFFAVISIAGAKPTGALLVRIWCFAVTSYFSATLVPTPGNSGAQELTSTVIFAAVAQDVIGWVILGWRFSTFYLYIVIGVCMSIFSVIRSAVRVRRTRRKA